MLKETTVHLQTNQPKTNTDRRPQFSRTYQGPARGFNNGSGTRHLACDCDATCFCSPAFTRRSSSSNMLLSHARMKRHPEAAKNIRPPFPHEYQTGTSCVGKTAQTCPVQLSARSRRTGPPSHLRTHRYRSQAQTSPDEARAKLEQPSPLSRRGTESAHATSEEPARLHPSTSSISHPCRTDIGPFPNPNRNPNSHSLLPSRPRGKERRRKKKRMRNEYATPLQPTQHEQQKSSTPMRPKKKTIPLHPIDPIPPASPGHRLLQPVSASACHTVDQSITASRFRR